MHSESSLTVKDTLELIRSGLVVELWDDGLRESLDSEKCTTADIYAAALEGIGILGGNYRDYAVNSVIYRDMADQFARLLDKMRKGQEVVIRGKVRISPEKYEILEQPCPSQSFDYS